MENDKQIAPALKTKNELYVMSRSLEETDTRGHSIRTMARVTIEWAPDLSEEEHRQMTRAYHDALDHVRSILSF